MALSAHYITTVCGQSMCPLFPLQPIGIPAKYVNIIDCFYKQVFFFRPFSLVPRNQLLSVAAACKVLIEFSLLRLENPDEACAVSQVSEPKHIGMF